MEITDVGRFKAHRLIWIYVYGSIPPGKNIDHIDGDRSNNALANLRLATPAENSWNSAAQKGRAGLKGVGYNRKSKRRPWFGRITVLGQKIHLGSFETPEEAHAAYKAAAKIHYGEFARSE